MRSLFNPVHSLKRSIRISISTSDRNRQNRPQKGWYPSLGDQVMIYPYQRNARQEDMTAAPQPVRRIGKRANQVKFGKQPNGTLFTVAMSPTTLYPIAISGVNDYGKKCT